MDKCCPCCGKDMLWPMNSKWSWCSYCGRLVANDMPFPKLGEISYGPEVISPEIFR